MTWITPLSAVMSVCDDGHVVAGGVGQCHRSVVGDSDGDGGAVDGGDLLAVEPDDVGGRDCAGHYVIGEDVGQVAGRIVEQRLDGARWQGGERVVGRSEDRERSLAAQRVLQSGRLNGGDERGEVAGGDRRVDDVGVGCRRGCRGHRRLRGGGRHGGGGGGLRGGRGGIGVGAVVATGAGDDNERSEAGDESKGSGGGHGWGSLIV